MATALQARALKLEEGTIRRLSAGLVNATALVRPSSRSPFDDFGVIAGRNLAPTRRPTTEIGFTIQEARERIADFIENRFNAKTLADLMLFLRDHLLRIESRRQPDGRSANYLVDVATKQSVLAASVDRRLARPGLARMFGRTLDAEAEAKLRDSLETPEQTEARRLRSFNMARLRGRVGDPHAPPFGNWEDMRFSAPSMFRGREMTVQGGEVWVGYQLALASEDPAENLAMLRRLKAEGHKFIVPAKTLADAKAGVFVAGMPIVAAEGAVRGKLIAPSLSFKKLSQAFGESPFAYFEEMARRKNARAPKANKVIDLAEFRSRFQRVERNDPIMATSTMRPDVVRQVLIRVGEERLTVVDPHTGAERAFDPATMDAGRYQKEDGFGLPCGFVEIDAYGGFAHLDEQERYHNAYGPAIVPPKASNERQRYAVDGVFMTRAEFADRSMGDRVSVRREPEPEPEVQSNLPRPKPGFRL